MDEHDEHEGIASEEMIASVQRLIDQRGMYRAAARIGLSMRALARLRHGSPVSRGALVHVERRLIELGESVPREADVDDCREDAPTVRLAPWARIGGPRAW